MKKDLPMRNLVLVLIFITLTFFANAFDFDEEYDRRSNNRRDLLRRSRNNKNSIDSLNQQSRNIESQSQLQHDDSLIQGEMDQQFGKLEKTINTLDNLVDQKLKTEIGIRSNQEKQSKVVLKKRKLQNKNSFKKFPVLKFIVPEFDPIDLSPSAMNNYQKRLFAQTPKRKRKNQVISLKDFIKKNESKFNQLSNSMSNYNLISQETMKNRPTFTKKNLDYDKLFTENTSTKRVKEIFKQNKARRSNFLLKSANSLNNHKFVARPNFHESAFANKINSFLGDLNNYARKMPKHELREEYQMSNPALEQLFGPKVEKMIDQKKKNQNLRKVFLKKIKMEKKIRKQLRKQKRQLRKESKLLDPLKAIFRVQNERDKKLKSILEIKRNMILSKPFKLSDIQPKPDSSIMNIKIVPKEKLNQHRKCSTNSSSNIPLMNDLFQINRLGKNQLPIQYPMLGHELIMNPGRNRAFIPTLAKISKIQYKVPNFENNRRVHFSFMRNLRNSMNFEHEIDDLVNEIQNSHLKVVDTII